MLAYPQLETGAISHFPLGKTQRARTVRNDAPDGSVIKLADSAGGSTEWVLTYEDLGDDEAAALLGFFASTEGTLKAFTFLDPAGNLLAWSDGLDHAAWHKDPLLTLTGNIADPTGTSRAWEVSNTGGGSQTVSQTLAAPGDYQYCLSVYVRASAPTSVELSMGSQRAQRNVTTGWSRVTLSANGDAGATSTVFGITIETGATVQLFGPQVEPQTGASGYKPSTSGGVYPNAHLGSDRLRITATDVNRNSCKVTILNVNHL